MGEQRIKARLDTTELRQFSRRVLDDLGAFKAMLDRGMIESGVRRIGAEQELFIIDEKGSPAMKALPLLQQIDDPAFTTELARFNLEFNLDPHDFGGDCLGRIEADICEHLAVARRAAAEIGCDVLMSGILPTIARNDLTLEAMTPMPRYRQLNDTLKEMRGGAFSLLIKGLDDLRFDHDNILFEACNTSFQVHFQVAPEEFARLYNLAQAVTGPLMAMAANSPVLLQHRLWRETRVALFQQSIDNRTLHQSVRGHRPRVSFGNRWVEESVLEIFREDITRYRMLLATEPDPDPMEVIERGAAPKLSALRLHNGTVYRWNRPCYGINPDGKAHLRIENRVLPAGPSAADEVANAALFFGLILALDEPGFDITKKMRFDDAKANFLNAARHGLKSTFTWLDGHDYKAQELLREELLPRAREGLLNRGLAPDDVHRYCDILEARLETRQTGAQWVLSSLESMGDAGSRDERYRSVVLATADRQRDNQPVHTWRLAALHETKDWRDSYRYIHQFMTTDLFTVRPEDIVDLAASVMEWEHIRHVPVEDDDGRLVGLVTMRDMLKVLAIRRKHGDEPVSVEQIMLTNPLTVHPDASSVGALRIMRDRKVSCLPVVDDDGMLVGLVTNYDLLRVAAGWMEEQLASFG